LVGRLLVCGVARPGPENEQKAQVPFAALHGRSVT
jgi:hypothetical protein